MKYMSNKPFRLAPEPKKPTLRNVALLFLQLQKPSLVASIS